MIKKLTKKERKKAATPEDCMDVCDSDPTCLGFTVDQVGKCIWMASINVKANENSFCYTKTTISDYCAGADSAASCKAVSNYCSYDSKKKKCRTSA